MASGEPSAASIPFSPKNALSLIRTVCLLFACTRALCLPHLHRYACNVEKSLLASAWRSEESIAHKRDGTDTEICFPLPLSLALFPSLARAHVHTFAIVNFLIPHSYSTFKFMLSALAYTHTGKRRDVVKADDFGLSLAARSHASNLSISMRTNGKAFVCSCIAMRWTKHTTINFRYELRLARLHARRSVRRLGRNRFLSTELRRKRSMHRRHEYADGAHMKPISINEFIYFIGYDWLTFGATSQQTLSYRHKWDEHTNLLMLDDSWESTAGIRRRPGCIRCRRCSPAPDNSATGRPCPNRIWPAFHVPLPGRSHVSTAIGFYTAHHGIGFRHKFSMFLLRIKGE